MQVNQRETGNRSAIASGVGWQAGEGSEAANRRSRIGTAAGGDALLLAENPKGAELIVLACVMSAFGVSPREIAGRSRGLAHVALARQVAMYMHHVVLRQTLTAVARRFARDRTTVAHACRVVEDRRDDPAFEECLDAIERAIQGAIGPLRRSPRGQG
ncbi:helix-turn-helix domain-containing protein [Stappia sp.]|uniref:helix-turn-helix domain-containing protein n=1 Tax=Stappia sp. TaxID=1870903 RepID=UPI003C7B7739